MSWSESIPKRYKQNAVNADLHRFKWISTNFEKEIYRIKKKILVADYPQKLVESVIGLYVLIMSRTCFRIDLHPTVAWMSRNLFLKTGTVWLNGWVLIYQLSDCGFESRCSVIVSFENDKVEKLEDDYIIPLLLNIMITLFFDMAKLDIIGEVPSCTKSVVSSKQFMQKFHNFTRSKFYLLIK